MILRSVMSLLHPAFIRHSSVILPPPSLPLVSAPDSSHSPLLASLPSHSILFGRILRAQMSRLLYRPIPPPEFSAPLHHLTMYWGLNALVELSLSRTPLKIQGLLHSPHPAVTPLKSSLAACASPGLYAADCSQIWTGGSSLLHNHASTELVSRPEESSSSFSK